MSEQHRDILGMTQEDAEFANLSIYEQCRDMPTEAIERMAIVWRLRAEQHLAMAENLAMDLLIMGDVISERNGAGNE